MPYSLSHLFMRSDIPKAIGSYDWMRAVQSTFTFIFSR